jgi:flagellar hook-length control protein FliK
MVHHGGGKMTVTLSPAHLGQVEIQVTTRGKKVEIEMKSQSDLAKSVIESRLSDLKQSLHGQDLHLSKVEVQVGREVARPMTGNSFTALAGGNQSFTGQNQHFSNGSHANTGRQLSSFNSPSTTATRSSIGHVSTVTARGAAGSGRVDIRI